MDMNRHNGPYGGDPRIMNLTRVCVQYFPKALETTRMVSRPWQMLGGTAGATCQKRVCLCASVYVFLYLLHYDRQNSSLNKARTFLGSGGILTGPHKL